MATLGKKRNPWTSSEEDILIKNVKNNVTNLAKAFRKTSAETGRSAKAIQAHWYVNTSRNSGHCLFMTVSGKHISINRKNSKGRKSTLPLFKKVLSLFGLTY